MGEVISLTLRQAKAPRADKLAGLTECFAKHRRIGDDVYWLKENAELLSTLACAKAQLSYEALEAYRGFYRSAEARLRFFPQYYRFMLSITLDLEELGMQGNIGEALCAFVAKHGLAKGELSDLQRAEAERLLARRGIGTPNTRLSARLHRFATQSDAFCLPNKKAGYELTHIVFYLSDYGRRDPKLARAVLRSLEHVGTLAFIEENADLLAEVCLALRYARASVPEAWETWLSAWRLGFRVLRAERGALDDYHEYLVLNWHAAQSGQSAFVGDYAAGGLRFDRPTSGFGLLRALSEQLYGLSRGERQNWSALRTAIGQGLGAAALAHLDMARAAASDFDRFFERFARG